MGADVSILSLTLHGFAQLFTVYHLGLMVLGMAGGIVAGALPGIGPSMAVALLLPFTLTMGPITGMILLGAIWVGAIYGGSITAILFKVPGTPASVATTLDGYPMTQKGEGDMAIVTALLSSCFGGLVGAILLLFLFVPLSQISLKFSKPEYFWLCVFGLTAISSISAKNVLMGVTAVILGLLISTIGMDPIMGTPRFTFGNFALMQGVHLVPALIGVFAFPQLCEMILHTESYEVKYHQRGARELLSGVGAYLIRNCKIILARSSILGTLIGVLPGAGTSIASIIGYNEAMRWDKHPEKYGTGCMEGVAASESANNGVIGGSCIPMMALAIPGCPTAAIIMGAFLTHGIVPGSHLLEKSGDIAFVFICSLVVLNFIMVAVGFFMGRPIAKVQKLPAFYIAPLIMVLCLLGAYTIRNSMTDVYIMLTIGISVFLGNKVGLPSAPVALGIVLGSIAEEALSVSLYMAQAEGSLLGTLIMRPICLVLIAICIVSALSPFFMKKSKSE